VQTYSTNTTQGDYYGTEAFEMLLSMPMMLPGILRQSLILQLYGNDFWHRSDGRASGRHSQIEGTGFNDGRIQQRQL
jgi:hypothetical protein